MQEVFEKIIEKLEDSKSNVPVNRLLDDIIKDKPKELGRLMAYNKSIEIVKQEAEKYEECYKDCGECEAYNKEKHHCPKFCKVIMEVVAKLKGMECEKDENNY